MDLEKEQTTIEWYDNPSIVTSLIIGLIAITIILSQSFAVSNNLSTVDILRSLLNHNSVYLILLVYFIALKTNTGKKYFDFLNVFLILLYFLTTVTSLLTVFQSFTLMSLLSLVLHGVLLIYLVHTFLVDTRIWKELKINKSPFNGIINENYFYAVVIVDILLLAVNLIATTTFDGTVLALFDCLYVLLFSRYIYLYKEFIDKKILKKKTVKKEDGKKSNKKTTVKKEVVDEKTSKTDSKKKEEKGE